MEGVSDLLSTMTWTVIMVADETSLAGRAVA
jgi:hypothetical protein